MTSRLPTESERADTDAEAPEDAQERFETLARGLLTTPREPVLKAEREFKERERRRRSN
jgi:hypothetical protein